METWIVETKNLKKYYMLGNHTVKALDGVDFQVKEQEFVAIIGKSGSGKSTLLHMIGGIDQPTSGDVFVAGKKLMGMTKEQLTIFRRRKAGFIFQNYNLVQDLNVYENIILPVQLDGRQVNKEFVDQILELLKLKEKRQRCLGCCPVVSSREWRLQGLLHRNPQSFLLMNRLGILTQLPVMMYWVF